MRRTESLREEEQGDRRREKSATSRRVQTKITEMHHRRAAYLREMQTRSPDTRATLEFQSAIVELAESLRPFRERAQEQWQAAGPDYIDNVLDRLPELTAATTATDIERVGFGRVKRVTREDPQTLPARTLLQLSHDLDDIAREVGFVNEPDQASDRIHADPV